MKSIKNIIAAFAFIVFTPVSANAAGVDIAVKTGDRGILNIVIAAVAFIVTAIITTKLTKYKNK